jgi:DNA-3-methyladenine glycosylase II
MRTSRRILPSRNFHSSQPDWAAGCRHLRNVDPVLREIIGSVGPCTLRRRRDYFVVLCKAIFSQQISTRVAEVLFGRFCDLFPRRRPTPQRVIHLLTKADPGLIRRCGASRQKQAYLLDLAEHFQSGKLPTARFSRMSDEQIIKALVDVKGIGRWTAEMFLIFVLNRPDVYPIDDLGLRKGVQRAYGMADLPTVKQLHEVGETCKPYRSVATWYFWQSLAGQKDRV